jgi:hypothetical protein
MQAAEIKGSAKNYASFFLFLLHFSQSANNYILLVKFILLNIFFCVINACMKIKDFTTRDLAGIFKVAEVTARVWCQKGHFPNAYQVETPFGSYWLVPREDVKTFQRPKVGRPYIKERKAA